MWSSTTQRNFRVTEGPDKTPLYYIETSFLVPGTPDVKMHLGEAKSGPVVGVARFPSMFAKTVQFGLGDPEEGESASAIAWEEMRFEKDAGQPKSEWHLAVTLDGRRRQFRWRHTHDVGPEAYKNSAQNYQLVDEEDGVLALFENRSLKSWSKKGKVSLYKGDAEFSGVEWERLVLLTVLTLVVKMRRIAIVSRGIYGV